MLQSRTTKVHFRTFSWIAVVLGGGALALAQINAETTLSAIRAVAGESRSAIWESEHQPPVSITSVNSSPAMIFPVRVVVDSSAGRTRLVMTIPPSTPAGDYTIQITGSDRDGRTARATFRLTVELVTVSVSATGRVPVILLNGWQSLCGDTASTLVASQDTFGSLWTQLQAQGVPVAYFNNCASPDVPIESLGSALASFIAGLTYTDGTAVAQVDLVAHSMGGLIARAYLAGLQQNGSLSPPLNPRVRKLVEIGTPNFGSFIAGDFSLFTAGGTQSGEMLPGSSFLWSLARWNQGGDDLRGVDALAIIGNLGSCCSVLFPSWTSASDGVVSITSASLGFASLGYARDPSRTRIVPYCHTTGLPTCSGPPIANVDLAPDTGAIVLSFLANTSSWQSIGTPSQTKYGGVYFALENAAETQYTSFTSVSLGSQPLQSGATNAVFYSEFASGTGTFQAISTTNQSTSCGPFTVAGGYYSTFRCKYSPVIASVGPLLSNASGVVVQSGGSITINGVGFGQQCSTCKVLAYPGSVQLQPLSWSDQAITATLPSYNGIAEVIVEAAAGLDSIAFMAAPAALPPSISLSSLTLQFSSTVGGALPPSQTITVSNSGGGTLTWSAAASASWLTFSSASGTLTVSVNPAGLSANTYTGVITITATGASNTPQTISVTLTVAAPLAAAPSISLSTNQANFTYTVGGAAPAPQSISIANSGGGTLDWAASSNSSWLSVTPFGFAPSTLTISATPANLTPGPYSGVITVTAPGATNSPQTVSVLLIVGAAAPSIAVTSVANSASGASGAIAPGEIVTIKGNGLGPANGVSFSVDPSTGMVDTTLAGTSVLFGSFAAPITYTSAGQINAIVPYEVSGQSQVTMQVQYQGATSAGTTLQVASAAPGAFAFSGTGSGQAVAANQDGSFNGASNPAATGSYVTIYFTGGGETNPPGVTGSVTGAVLKWLMQAVSVTVGNVPATVAFDGAAPTFVDGVGQLNIQLANNTPSGTQPLVITVGGFSSPTTATLSVQ